jgi:hypothetical protein
MTPIRWPTSRPRKASADEIPDNPMNIGSGDLGQWIIDWIVWQYAWEVVYSDAGNMQI